MKRKLACLFCLTAITLSALAFEPHACGDCKEISGEGKASKDNSYGIEVTVYEVRCQGDIVPESQIEFFYVRRRVDTGQEEEMAVASNNNAIFDVSAEKDVLYEYIIYIRFKDEKDKMRLKTPRPVEGLRPSVSNYNIRLDYLKGTHLKDTCVLIWEFIGIDKDNIKYYYLEITSDPNHTWSPRRGFSNNPAKSFTIHSAKKNWLKVPNRKKHQKIWVCIRLIHKNGSSEFFYIEVPIKTGGPVASSNPKNALELPDLSKPAERFQAGKSYGLSYIPETIARVSEKPGYASIDPEEFLYSPSVTLDNSIADYLDVIASPKPDLSLLDACLKPYSFSEGDLNEGRLAATGYPEWRRLAFKSQCISYELSAMKIEVQEMVSEDGSRRKKMAILPNEYATIEKYQKTRGLFVWVELPTDCKLNSGLMAALQSRLRQLGYYHENVDGTFNLNLRMALVQYQKNKKLPIGNLDLATIASLGIDLE